MHCAACWVIGTKWRSQAARRLQPAPRLPEAKGPLPGLALAVRAAGARAAAAAQEHEARLCQVPAPSAGAAQVQEAHATEATGPLPALELAARAHYPAGSDARREAEAEADEAYAGVYESDDYKEGVRSFLERRRPIWSGK